MISTGRCTVKDVMYKIFIKDQRLYVVLVINKDVVFKGIVGCMMCDERR